MGKPSPHPPAYDLCDANEAVEMISRKVEPAPFAEELPDRERKGEGKGGRRKMKMGILIGIVVFLLVAITIAISIWATRVRRSGLAEEQTDISPGALSNLATSSSTITMIMVQSTLTSTSIMISTKALTYTPSSTTSTVVEETSSKDSSTELRTIVVTTYTNLPGSNSASSEPDTTTTWLIETVMRSKSHTPESEVSISVTTVISPSPYTVTQSISDSSSSTDTSSSTRSFPPPFASRLSQPHPDTTTTNIDDLMTLLTTASSDSVTPPSATPTPDPTLVSTLTTSACIPASTYVDVDYCHWVTDCNIEAMRAKEKCYRFCSNQICQDGEKDQKNMPQGQLHCCGLCGCFG